MFFVGEEAYVHTVPENVSRRASALAMQFSKDMENKKPHWNDGTPVEDNYAGKVLEFFIWYAFYQESHEKPDITVSDSHGHEPDLKPKGQFPPISVKYMKYWTGGETQQIREYGRWSFTVMVCDLEKYMFDRDDLVIGGELEFAGGVRRRYPRTNDPRNLGMPVGFTINFKAFARALAGKAQPQMTGSYRNGRVAIYPEKI